MKLVAQTAFLWLTQDGEALTPAEMKTSHLFYTLRMIFNHTAPSHYQILGCRRYALNQPREYLCAAVVAMVAELKDRPKQDLAFWQWYQLRHMADVCLFISTTKLD